MQLKILINELVNFVERGDQVDPEVSINGTFWHVDHTMRVIAGSVNQLYRSEKKSFWTGINFSKLHLYLFGSIPRGKYRAPKFVSSAEPVSVDIIRKRERNVRFALNSLHKTEARQCFKHQVLGRLNKKQTIKFLEVHTEHHLKIIRDILNNSN